MDTTRIGTQPDPNHTLDPPKGEGNDKQSKHLEGDVAEISLDYTLSEEGEGDNINGSKELRNEGDNKDKNNSKRLKGSIQPPTEE